MTQRVLVCVDAGGTNIRVGVFDPDGVILARHLEPTRSGPDADDAARHLVQVVRRAAEPYGPVLAAAVGVPALVDFAAGHTLDCPNIPELAHRPLRADLVAALGTEVVLANDGSLATIGEHRHGAGRGIADLLCITIGTGIGGGLVLGDRFVWGRRGFAGEIGEWLVPAVDGPGGRLVRLELVASASAIAAEAGTWAGLATRYPAPDARPEDQRTLRASWVAQAALAGEARAAQLFDRVGWYIGVALANVAMLVDLEKIVIGGGLARAGKILLDPIVDAFATHVVGSIGAGVDIVASSLGDDAALLGGAALLLDTEGTLRPGRRAGG